MNLNLSNIGIVKHADIKVDGLTVIAGENDSGKSTVGKVLYALVKSTSKSHFLSNNLDVTEQYIKPFNEYIGSLFKNQISRQGDIEFNYNNVKFDIKIENDRCADFTYSDDFISNDLAYYGPILIETPYIWSILTSLNTIRNLEAHDTQIDFELSPTLKDLYTYLMTKLKFNDDKIKLNIDSIINGKFEKDTLSNFVFKKDNKNIELQNTAMGIKYFGLLQVLSDNNYFFKNQILILDEPEVHLHPKWQLRLAELIVQLVKNGVKIVVNSHSPYMIEALQRYSQKEQIANHFYLADDGMIVEDADSLSKIFAKLSEPFDEFDKLDSEILHG